MSHRSLLARAVATLAVGAAVLAGCASPAETPAPATPAAGGAYPVTIPNAYGEATIPAEPARVVAVGFNEADFLLALGVVPVGVRDFIGEYDETARPWAQEALAGAQPADVGGTEINVEAVAALEPDLIMGVYSFMDRATYDALSAIAPTVGPVSADGTVGWEEQTRITGTALGREDRAADAIATVEQAFADARAANPGFAGRNVTIDLPVDGVPYLLGADDLRSSVFTGVGLTVPETTTELGPETIGQLDSDALIVLGATAEDMAGDPLFQSLPVVQEGRTLFTGGYDEDFNGAIGFGSPLSLPYAVELITPQLAAVLG
ncbi:iron-siderophore ABC transporter substrate-binding protein [Pseudonocardia oceani]|uniref:Iron-siderophore ABC transporter substrate-binding protein n=4 Tax=Pseudonocardia oceani TaxID=2792013 RepID=A0ABS6UJG3_9PSEU|nr:iron-siderophore ABC transporter substrate-binding protein [Pseudonocardia oceani]MBW0124042.1 iron-siderophore ABC transporter substrate-binding protein [Pseudonocardia oceani]MBW0132383.1 iron-siderophore ABC transporter substrate-binding protein [Pseudonocardia oceani]